MKKIWLIRISSGVLEYNEKNLLPLLTKNSIAIDSMMRIYMKAQMEMQPMKKFYPDANFTLRIAYGNIKGYQPDDAVTLNILQRLTESWKKKTLIFMIM